MNAIPLEIQLDPAAVEGLRDRIRATKWAPERPAAGWTFGVPGIELRRLATYWADGFDFRAAQSQLNHQPHFQAPVEDIDVHFIHRRGIGRSPLPLVLTHGWPWTFWDYAKVIEPLADPARFGGDSRDAFDVIVPSLPGFPFSGKPARPVGFVETADLWRRLLVDVLGYARFGAHGADSGAFVTAQLAHAHEDVLLGAHLTFPALLGASIGDSRDRPALQTHFLTHIFEPQTLSWAMHDSPVGMLAWMLQRRRSWSDCDGDVSRRFSDDELLLATTLYWLSDSFASSVRYYADSFGMPWTPRHGMTPTLRAPTGIAVFPKELRRVPRSLAQEHANLVHWSEMPRGGHFAASEEPQLLIDDLRTFFSANAVVTKPTAKFEGDLMLNAASIIAAAEDQVGVTDSDRAVRGNLEQLVDSLKRDGDLSEEGIALTRRHLLSDTVNRLEGLKWVSKYPEIATELIAAPVFLMGLPRSGTTYFQYLFDRDPRFRLIRTWESMTPYPPPGFDHASALKRKSEWSERRRREHPTFEGFDALHLYDEDGSDECHAFLEQSFGAAGLHNLFRVPDYFDYILDGLDLVETYRIHRRQLQLLQWRSPGRPWALKYPNHVIAMNEILQVYPDARFVMTHRDPLQTLASISKMTFNLRRVRSGNTVDPYQVGAEMLHFVQRHIDRIMQFDLGEQSRRVVHVDYYALVEDPAAALRQIHAGLEVDSPDEVVEAVAQWRRANPKNARGRNDYTLEQWGLEAEVVTERFGNYMRRFNIPREQEGLTRGAH